jgi:hypothetical protein
MQGMIGPFKTGDMLIVGIIMVIVCVVAALARGMLMIPLMIPAWLLLIAITVILMLGVLLVLTIARYWMNGKEGFVFSIARATGLPVYIDAELGSGDADFVLGEKTKPKDITFKDEVSGIKIDPSLLSKDAIPMNFAKGLRIYIYSYYNYMPQSIRNHAAFKAIEDYFNDECPELNFLTVKEFVELVSDPEHFLEHNALIKLNKYFKIQPKKDKEGKDVLTADNKPVLTYVRQFQTKDIDEFLGDGTTPNPTFGQMIWIVQDMGLPDMLQAISKARKDISKLPVTGGYLAGTEAFKNNSVAYSSQHFAHALMLYLAKIKAEAGNQERILLYCIGAAIVLLGGGLSFYIINMAPK